MFQVNFETNRLDANTSFDTLQTPPSRLTGVRMSHFTEQAFPKLFEGQVARQPARIALTCDNESLTYFELNARANQLAAHLKLMGVERDSLVGICIDRSLEMAIGIIGILKAGGAYLPLDPDYPRERLAFMLSDAQPALVLTKAKLAAYLSEAHSRLVLLDQDWPVISQNSTANLSDGPSANDLAYVIYTSGSTGKPKGVMITHGNLANYLCALNHELQIGASDRYLHTASMAFSSSRRQLMLPLSQGAMVVLATSDQRKDPTALLEMVKQSGITVMDAVPSFWRNCTAILSGLSTADRERLLDNQLRLMLSASEPLLSDIPHTWSAKFGHRARHVHMFGQTETAGIVSLYRVPENPSGEVYVVPIGGPIANTEIFVLDEELRACPVGVAGELYVGGAGVGRGYLNLPILTAEKFVPHPFNEESGARLYRTGDWARLNADYQIEFTGRQDQQVKLRGFRIELGEVETALAKHPAIRESAVVVRGERDGEKRLVAYFVADGPAPTVSELRSFLASQLPDFVVPSALHQLPALPLSANGKVNRLALPDLAPARPNLSADYIAPRNEIEMRLAAIWSEVLHVEQIGVEDNFFELGGHSLLAAQVIARVRREFQREISLRLMFECPNVARLAHAVQNADPNDQRLSVPSITAFERNGAAPLSFNQQQFWLLDQVAPNRSAYNVRSAIRINGALDVQKLQRALETVVARHEVLRTNIVVHQGTPVQVIAASMPVPLPVSDLTSLSAVECEEEMKRALEAEATEPFKLSSGPLLRTKLLKLSDDEQVLLLTIHHIACDGWSISLLLREVGLLYENGESSPELPALPIQYADFAQWQRNRLQGETLERQLEYWRQELEGVPTAIDLPFDYARPATRNFSGARKSVLLPLDLSNSLKTLSRNEDATLFMTLLAAFQMLLSRHSGQKDIAVGSPVAGRSMLETESLIGAFVNTLVLRGDLEGNPSFREFLGHVRETVLGAFSHQDLPFEKLVEKLNPERNVDRSPLFQVMFALQNTPGPDLALPGLSLTPLQLEGISSKFDLSLDVEEQTDGLLVTFEYSTELFASGTIERMLGHFQNLLAAVVLDPQQRAGELQVLTDSETRELLVERNNTRADFPLDVCVHELFEAQVTGTPEAIAVEFQGERVTYRELNSRANQLANYLRQNGVGPEMLVGICIERSVEMLVAILGVLKAGGGYLPLDSKYPRERIAFMVEDAGVSIILTQQQLIPDLPNERARLVAIDAAWETIAKQSAENLNVPVQAGNLALLLYTSGSTGNPKGVMIEHRSLAHYTSVAATEYKMTAGDRVLQFASLSFDMSAEEIHTTLTSGATLVLRTEDMISTVGDFFRCCEDWKISVLDLPTAYWHELTDGLSSENLQVPAGVRLVIMGGEKALPERVATWQRLVGERVRLVNTYGPTETTVVATMFDLGTPDDPHFRHNVPIGRPIANTTVYILDEFLQPVPAGVAGELHLGGAGIVRGYVNRPDLTASKFIPDTFGGEPGAKLYKTGDVVRYRADGQIEFLGRVDNQIKIRGFRVELDEIESVLRQHARVHDCVVIAHEDKGDKRLVAYVVPTEQSQPVVSELRNSLKTKLPSYMVPAAFEVIDALPLMPSGKINRRALPDPQYVSQPDENFVAPRTPIEEMLATAWREVLKLELIGIHDNFFDLGGHSLLAAKVVSLVRNLLDVEFGMVDVFQAPTIASLAELLYPRTVQEEPHAELAELLAELANLSDEEARRRFDHEMQRDQVAAA
jgi:amino acid adenylation domain-containing protein